jgi:hypothetical protein
MNITRLNITISDTVKNSFIALERKFELEVTFGSSKFHEHIFWNVLSNLNSRQAASFSFDFISIITKPSK